MLRAGPRYIVEERRDCVLVWNELDFSMPRRMVASFPSHPHDKGESAILAEICAAALNRELPGRVTETPDPELDVPPVAATRQPAEAPAATAPVQPAPATPPASQPMTPLQAYAATRVAQRERKAMPDVSGLKGRDKVQAMRKSLFGDDDPNAQGAQP